MGTNAELYFVVYVPDEIDPWISNESDLVHRTLLELEGGEFAEWWHVAMGERTSDKSYQCWRWDIYHYVQTKPWRTVNLNTSWKHSFFTPNKVWKLRLIEYDPVFHDRGASFWCWLSGMAGYTYARFSINLDSFLSGILGGLVELFCEVALITDDPIGGKLNFQDIVNTAASNPGVVYEWGTSDFRIKLKME